MCIYFLFKVNYFKCGMYYEVLEMLFKLILKTDLVYNDRINYL